MLGYTTAQAAVATGFNCWSRFAREKLNFPCNYYKYIRGLHTAGIAINDLVDKGTILEEEALARYVCRKSSATDVWHTTETGSSAYLSLFDDLDYEQNNELLSSTQIEIDDNLNVTIKFLT